MIRGDLNIQSYKCMKKNNKINLNLKIDIHVVYLCIQMIAYWLYQLYELIYLKCIYIHVGVHWWEIQFFTLLEHEKGTIRKLHNNFCCSVII